MAVNMRRQMRKQKLYEKNAKQTKAELKRGKGVGRIRKNWFLEEGRISWSVRILLPDSSVILYKYG